MKYLGRLVFWLFGFAAFAFERERRNSYVENQSIFALHSEGAPHVPGGCLKTNMRAILKRGQA